MEKHDPCPIMNSFCTIQARKCTAFWSRDGRFFRSRQPSATHFWTSHSPLIECQFRQNKKCVWSCNVLTYYPRCSCASANSPARMCLMLFFIFGLLLTQTSLGLPLDACMGYKEDCTFFPVNAFPFFFSRSNVFYFIVRKRILSTDSCSVIVVYLQGVGV